MNDAYVVPPQLATASTKIPWRIFLFLSVVFFAAQHNWYFSLAAGEGFTPTVDEYTAITEQGNLLRRIVFFSLGIYALLSIFQMRSCRFKVNSLGWLTLFLLAWACLSLAWSVNPDFTLKRVILLTMLCLGAFAISQRFSPRDIVLWVFLSALAYLHLGILAEIVLGTFHPLSGDYRFAGTIHPNSQGINCALLLFASFFVLKGGVRWRKTMYLIVGESLIFLLLTKSRTSLILTLLALFLYWFITLPLSRKGAVVLGLLFVTCLLLLLGDYMVPFLQEAISLGRKDTENITLTGRIPIWEQALSYISKRPIHGYGYDSFWTARHIAEIAREQNWTVTQAHSMYIDIALSLGLAGAGSFLLIIADSIRRAFRTFKCTRVPAYGFFMVVLTFAALDGLLESIIIQPTHATFVCMLAVATFGFSRQPAVQER